MENVSIFCLCISHQIRSKHIRKLQNWPDFSKDYSSPASERREKPASVKLVRATLRLISWFPPAISWLRQASSKEVPSRFRCTSWQLQLVRYCANTRESIAYTLHAVVNGEYVFIQFNALDEKVRCHVRCSEVKEIMLFGITCYLCQIILYHPPSSLSCWDNPSLSWLFP